jgi:DNA polymerase-4
MGPAFVENLPVGRFHGVGPATTAKMNRLGIETGLDLRAQTMPFLQQHFGKSGSYFYWIARGIDDRPVRADRIRKSIGAENTFSVDLFTFEAAQDALLPIIEKVWRHCETSGTRGRTVTLKIKYMDFQQITRSISLPGAIQELTALERIALDLLKEQFPVAKGIRLLGISLSTFAPADLCDAEQLPLGI